jgi:hypothetical protein
VTQPLRDYFALCLSGGGIRSATFNLGLLQALAEKGVLDRLDYLSTVSGGGYIGGFWTAWQYNQLSKQTPGAAWHELEMKFPVRTTGPAQQERERPEVRHLREFSRFLIPRVGFTQSETWNAATVVFGGTLISLVVTASAVAAVLYAWLWANRLIGGQPFFGVDGYVMPAEGRAVTFGLLTLALHWSSEYMIWRVGKLGKTPYKPSAELGFAAAVLSGLGWALISGSFGMDGILADPKAALDGMMATIHVGPAAFATSAPALVWLASAVVLLTVRGIAQRLLRPAYRNAIDRAIGRCMAPAILALGLSAIWCTASALSGPDAPSLRVGAGIGGGAVGLFLMLRDWLKEPVKETRGSQLFDRVFRWLRPVLPQLAALVAVAIFLLGVAIFVHHFSQSRWVPLAVTLVFLSSLIWFDPALVGLHEFYRARIARCFLGAARAEMPSGGPIPPAATVEQEGDDRTLGELRDTLWGKAPLHLVCCAANNLSGDVLGSLYRGARSATLSPLGVSLGNFSSPRDKSSLSSVLTASAAAFNSQMGGISLKLGPAVAFLMCALNLRLGLWIDHPLHPKTTRWLPGWNFVLEALGRTRSDQVGDQQFFAGTWSRATQLHLSDGGHFETLGLYELVRRHCRHIIVSDASADPTSSFDDLGNAIRRVREDFGVEIEIDIEPLRPNEKGFARQHAVVGTIHYHGLDSTDKGQLIYFKPTLTGDEPVDVAQFRVRNPQFPHDGTGDQFYDEAQWESYRRLGQHAASAIVGLPDEDLYGHFVDKLFVHANQRLQVLDPALQGTFLDLTDRFQQLVIDLRDHAPLKLRLELFPELAAAPGAAVDAKKHRNPLILTRSARPQARAPSPRPTISADEENATIVYYVMLILQVMEDVWLGARLDDRWAHPLNDGWMNYFHRWASTPSFRTWWPVLRPIYNPGFRDFVKARFKLVVNEPARGQRGAGATLDLRPFNPSSDEDGMALKQWGTSERRASAPKARLVYNLKLEGSGHKAIQVGLLHYDLSADERQASWDGDDFFIVPALIGAGIQSRFLDAIVAKLGFRHDLCVTLDKPLGRSGGKKRATRSLGDRAELLQRITFYKTRGFQEVREGDAVGKLLRRPRTISQIVAADKNKLFVSSGEATLLARAVGHEKYHVDVPSSTITFTFEGDGELAALRAALKDLGASVASPDAPPAARV